MRKQPLISGDIYHIFTKSIAGFHIFRTDKDYSRMIELFKFYRIKKPPCRFSSYIEIKGKEQLITKIIASREHLVEIAAYCLMPTHIHLVLRQMEDNGISIFMKNILDSYTRYFNIRTKRKGPLWESRFKNVLVEDDEQLLHLTRYLHLNPSSDGIVSNPMEWQYSSYVEYIGLAVDKICNMNILSDILPHEYKDFVESRMDYQKEISRIKALLLE